MADKNQRIRMNIDGKYYVDITCICCGICTLTAPVNFMVNLNKEFGYVKKQPENKEEENAVIAAMAQCPVGAIGDDGEIRE
jgi:ferredoxin